MPTSVSGAPQEQEAEGSQTLLLQSAATADGNGVVALTDGMNGAQMVELQKTGTGTTNVNLEGSYDQTVWYAVGYYQVDGIGSAIARSAAIIAVAGGAVNHVYQALDLYPYLRARLSGTAGSVTVQVKLYAVPV